MKGIYSIVLCEGLGQSNHGHQHHRESLAGVHRLMLRESKAVAEGPEACWFSVHTGRLKKLGSDGIEEWEEAKTKTKKIKP